MVRSAVATALALALAGCGSTSAPPPPPRGTLLVHASFAAALAPLPDGGLLFGERLTGRIRRVTPGGRLVARPVARVAVSTGGQRGLLGLAVDRGGAVYAAWTAPSRRLLVARIAPGRRRLVWRGPASADLANGGHLAFARDGSLLIGIGDVQMPPLIRVAGAPNGKLLALDPRGAPAQTPRALTDGWNNPFAFAVAPDGRVWVADNSPGARPERIGRGDARGPLRSLARKTAPSGMAAISSRELAVCGYISGQLDRYRIGSGGRVSVDGPPIARGCQVGVARLADGRLAFATPTEIRTIRP